MSIKSILLGLILLGLLTACGTPQAVLPTLTKIPISTASPHSITPFYRGDVPWKSPVPYRVETPVPLSETDSMYLQLTAKGYQLMSSGSLARPNGLTYSAHLFINPDLSPRYSSNEPATKDAILIAFYRHDREKNVLLSLQDLPPLKGDYASTAAVVNWNVWSQMGKPLPLRLNVDGHADEETRPILKQDQYASDINQNGLPEFTVILEFCACSLPDSRIHLFELQDAETVKNITQDLPGDTSFSLHSKTPLTFYVVDNYAMEYGVYGITTYWIYAWDGSKFVDVSANYADEYLAAVSQITNKMKSEYGKLFEELSVSWFPILKILKLYEKPGMQKEGLQVFLDVTDISHWPGTSNENQCLLQLVRAGAQEDVKHNRKFDLNPSNYWALRLPYIDKTYTASLKRTGYDISACDLVKE